MTARRERTAQTRKLFAQRSPIRNVCACALDRQWWAALSLTRRLRSVFEVIVRKRQPSDLQTPPGSACTIADLRFGLYCSSLPPLITYTWSPAGEPPPTIALVVSTSSKATRVPTLVLLPSSVRSNAACSGLSRYKYQGRVGKQERVLLMCRAERGVHVRVCAAAAATTTT